MSLTQVLLLSMFQILVKVGASTAGIKNGFFDLKIIRFSKLPMISNQKNRQWKKIAIEFGFMPV